MNSMLRLYERNKFYVVASISCFAIDRIKKANDELQLFDELVNIAV